MEVSSHGWGGGEAVAESWFPDDCVCVVCVCVCVQMTTHLYTRFLAFSEMYQLIPAKLVVIPADYQVLMDAQQEEQPTAQHQHQATTISSEEPSPLSPDYDSSDANNPMLMDVTVGDATAILVEGGSDFELAEVAADTTSAVTTTATTTSTTTTATSLDAESSATVFLLD